jgi:hypothetical protein
MFTKTGRRGYFKFPLPALIELSIIFRRNLGRRWKLSDKQRSLRETLHEVRATVRESRALVALSRGRHTWLPTLARKS